MLLLALALVSVFANATTVTPVVVADATTVTPVAVADATTVTPVVTEAPAQILTIKQQVYVDDPRCSGKEIEMKMIPETKIGACVSSGFAPAPAVSFKFTCEADNVVKETRYTQADCAGAGTPKLYLLNNCNFDGLNDDGTKVKSSKYTFSGACLKDTANKSLVKLTEADLPLSVPMVILLVIIFSALCTAFCCFVAYCGQPVSKTAPGYGQFGQTVTIQTADGKSVEAVLR